MMYKAVKTSLVNASRVMELLIELYGSMRILQVERRSENIFQVVLKDSTLALAIVQADGSLDIQEMEVC